MSKACRYCRTVNPTGAKRCMECGKPLASGGVSSSSQTLTNRTGVATCFCTKCRKQVRVLGNYTKFCEPRSPVKLYREEWEFRALECKHDIPIRKTGREDDDITGF
jgi:hypothetical protein